MRGGAVASTHSIELDTAGGAVVLRRFLKPRSPGWPPIEREAAALTALGECELPFLTPRVVAFDVDGSACGHPAILLTKVMGSIDLSPSDSTTRARALGRALAQLHTAEPRQPSQLEPFRLQLEPSKADPSDVDWPRVRRLLTNMPRSGWSLIHGDYHMGNVLFQRGELTGIVDWTCVTSGPWQFDVGYCRCDLQLLFGAREADAFLQTYEATRGERLADVAFWELAGAIKAHPDGGEWLPGWLDAGRSDLSLPLVRERLTAFVARALSRC
jgi:aminoglycoside phosphotransferase (APT) family kinase protein